MKLQPPLSLLGSVATFLLLLSGCDPEKPTEPSAEERCAALACASGQCMEDAQGALVCQPEGTLLDERPSGSDRLEAGDRKVYLFHATVGSFYRFRCTSTNAQWQLEMFNPSGDKVATGGGTYNMAVEVLHKALVAGLYSVVVTHPGGEPASCIYELFTSSPDDHGGDLATATPLTLGATTAGRLDVPTDSDAFRWTSEARRIYQVTVGGRLLMAFIQVQDADTKRPLALVSADTLSQTSDRTFFVSAPAAGSLLLHVSGTNSMLSGGEYTVRVEALGLDDHSDHDDLATALQVPTAPSAGALDYPGDVDSFRFSATAGHRYRVRCTPGTLTRCHMELRGDNVWPMPSANDELRFEATQTATYTVRMSSAGTGSYTYALEELGPDDHGGTTASATPLQLGGTARGVVEVPTDVDAFTLPVQAGRLYRVTCAADERLRQCQLSVGGPDGFLVSYGTAASPSTTTFEAKADHGYAAYVRGVNGSMGAYTVSVEDSGVDDHGDTPDTASPLTLGAQVTGLLETRTDQDTFSVALTAGTRYPLTLTGTPSPPRLSVLLLDGRRLDFSPGEASFVPSATGTYVFIVQPQESQVDGSYALTVR